MADYEPLLARSSVVMERRAELPVEPRARPEAPAGAAAMGACEQAHVSRRLSSRATETLNSLNDGRERIREVRVRELASVMLCGDDERGVTQHRAEGPSHLFDRDVWVLHP